MAHKVFYIFAIISACLIISCNQKEKKVAKNILHTDSVTQKLPETLSDSMLTELKMAHKRSMELYADEQFNKYVEYIYPHLFKYLASKHRHSDAQKEKDKYVDMLLDRNERYWEKHISLVAQNVTSYRFVFNSVEKTMFANQNILVKFNQKAYYYIGKDVIKNKALDLRLAIYLGKEKKWYFLDYNNKDNREILTPDFGKNKIDTFFAR